jgi:hypothetical protein
MNLNPEEYWEIIQQSTKDSVHATLLSNPEKWMALVATNEMIRNKEQPVYISGMSGQSIEQLEEQIKARFYKFGGFDNVTHFFIHLKNAGMDALDLNNYPEELRFLQMVIDLVWN